MQTNSAALRDRYEAAARERHDSIARAIRGAGAEHLVLATDRDWLIDIVKFVSRAGGPCGGGRRGSGSPGPAPAPRRRRCRPRGVLDELRIAARLLLIVVPLVLLGAYLIVQRSRRKYAAALHECRPAGVGRAAPARLATPHLGRVDAGRVGGARSSVSPARRATNASPASAARSCSRSTRLGSMSATDVDAEPARGRRRRGASLRREAARRASRSGLLTFDSNARVLAAPRPIHQAVLTAIDNLDSRGGTATGDAIYQSLAAIASQPARRGRQEGRRGDRADERRHTDDRPDRRITASRPWPRPPRPRRRRGFPIDTIVVRHAGTGPSRSKVRRSPCRPIRRR